MDVRLCNGVRNRCKGKLLPRKQKPPLRYLNNVEVRSYIGLSNRCGFSEISMSSVYPSTGSGRDHFLYAVSLPILIAV